MWVVTRHQHEISTLVPQTLFRVACVGVTGRNDRVSFSSARSFL